MSPFLFHDDQCLHFFSQCIVSPFLFHDDQCIHYSVTITSVSISISRWPVSPFLCHDDQCLHFYFTMTSVSISLSRWQVSPFLFHDDQCLHFFFTMSSVSISISWCPGSVSISHSRISHSRRPGSPFLCHDYQCLNFSFTMTRVSISHSRCVVSPFLFHDVQYLHFYFTITTVSISSFHDGKCFHVSISQCPVSPFLFHDDQGLHFSFTRWAMSPFLHFTMTNISIILLSHDAQCLPSCMTRVSIPIFYDMNCFYSYDHDLHSSITLKPVFSFLYVYNESIIFYDVKCVHSYFLVFTTSNAIIRLPVFLNEQYLLSSFSGCLVSPFAYFLITNVFTPLSHDDYCLLSLFHDGRCIIWIQSLYDVQCLNFHITWYPVSSFLYYHDDHCLYSCILWCQISQFLYLTLTRVSVSLLHTASFLILHNDQCLYSFIPRCL